MTHCGYWGALIRPLGLQKQNHQLLALRSVLAYSPLTLNFSVWLCQILLLIPEDRRVTYAIRRKLFLREEN